MAVMLQLQQQQKQQQQAITIPAIAPPDRVPGVGFDVDSVSTGVAVVVAPGSRVYPHCSVMLLFTNESTESNLL